MFPIDVVVEGTWKCKHVPSVAAEHPNDSGVQIII